MDLHSIISESFNVKKEIITDNLIVLNLPEWDSMGHMLFITKLEEYYKIELTGDEIASMKSVSDIKNIIDKKK